MPAPDPTSLGGYRLVRRLGGGSRADVFLGAGSAGTVALKVYRQETDDADIGRELDALGRVPAPHCARLLDVVTGPAGRVVPILARVHRGSLAGLLREREVIAAGEAVTLLAPLADTVLALHRAGVAHSRLGASSVHLGAAGEPVILGFGHADLFESGASVAKLDANPAAAGDRADLAALAALVLGVVRPNSAGASASLEELHGWVADVVHGPPRFEFLAELRERLFSLAEAEPIEFVSGPSTVDHVPARAVEARPVVVQDADTAAPALTGRPAARSTARAVDRMRELVLLDPVVIVRRRVATAARSVRKPVWIIAGAVVCAFVLTLAVVPQGSDSTRASTGESGSAPDATRTSTPFPRSTPLPADPVLALPVLLAERTTCIRDRSVLCLDAVDEQGSAAYSADAELVQGIQGGGEVPASATIRAPAPTLIETLGDSALVRLGPTANRPLH